MNRFRSEKGITLVETLISAGLLIVVAAGLLPLGTSALSTTESNDLVARAAEYAQDKMEQLLALSYGDQTTNTTTFPSTSTGGTGLAAGGNADPENPATGYVDYLDANGNLIAFTSGPPSGWVYRRVWQVTVVSANLKRITVTTLMASSGLGRGIIPRATVVTLKSFPF